MASKRTGTAELSLKHKGMPEHFTGCTNVSIQQPLFVFAMTVLTFLTC